MASVLPSSWFKKNANQTKQIQICKENTGLSVTVLPKKGIWCIMPHYLGSKYCSSIPRENEGAWPSTKYGNPMLIFFHKVEARLNNTHRDPATSIRFPLLQTTVFLKQNDHKRINNIKSNVHAKQSVIFWVCFCCDVSSLYHFCFSAAAPTKPCVHVCILQLGWFIAMRLNLTSTLLFSMGTKLNTVVGEGKGSPLLTHSHGSSSFRF